jgi:cyclopropane fatty-acyl-phospholipid synthase-like methyltransferase
MIFERLKLKGDIREDDFNKIYPRQIRIPAKRHWTPVSVARLATEFLAEKKGANVLDIGSGVGKFCMIGSATTNGNFTGVEQRRHLVDISDRISRRYKLKNLRFIHSNITTIEFKDYNAFYFFNSFFENIDQGGKIDDTVNLERELYEVYSNYVFRQFYLLPVGTRLATYHAAERVVPSNYELRHAYLDGLLKLWEKRR